MERNATVPQEIVLGKEGLERREQDDGVAGSLEGLLTVDMAYI